MSNNLSSNRLIRNEQIIRNRNTETKNGIKKFFQNNKRIKATPMEFICECSAIDCTEKVLLTINAYEKIHQRKDRFAIATGHQVDEIEDVLIDLQRYSIVEKTELAP